MPKQSKKKVTQTQQPNTQEAINLNDISQSANTVKTVKTTKTAKTAKENKKATKKTTKQTTQSNQSNKPNQYKNITILYIEMRKDYGNLVELSYTLFKQNDNENSGKYIMIQQPQVLQIKPQNATPEIEYFNDKYELNDCIDYLIQNVIRKEKFDCIVYNDALPMQFMVAKDPSIQLKWKHYKAQTFLKMIWTKNQMKELKKT